MCVWGGQQSGQRPYPTFRMEVGGSIFVDFPSFSTLKSVHVWVGGDGCQKFVCRLPTIRMKSGRFFHSIFDENWRFLLNNFSNFPQHFQKKSLKKIFTFFQIVTLKTIIFGQSIF